MSKDGETVRRRRHCESCGRRFTTYETVSELPYQVVKKDERREPFDREKVLRGLLRACEKRPVPMPKILAIVRAAEDLVMAAEDRECPTDEIGKLVMRELRRTDIVAYVRFASVYQDFKSAEQFLRAILRVR